VEFPVCIPLLKYVGFGIGSDQAVIMPISTDLNIVEARLLEIETAVSVVRGATAKQKPTKSELRASTTETQTTISKPIPAVVAAPQSTNNLSLKRTLKQQQGLIGQLKKEVQYLKEQKQIGNSQSVTVRKILPKAEPTNSDHKIHSLYHLLPEASLKTWTTKDIPPASKTLSLGPLGGVRKGMVFVILSMNNSNVELHQVESISPNVTVTPNFEDGFPIGSFVCFYPAQKIIVRELRSFILNVFVRQSVLDPIIESAMLKSAKRGFCRKQTSKSLHVFKKPVHFPILRQIVNTLNLQVNFGRTNWTPNPRVVVEMYYKVVNVLNQKVTERDLGRIKADYEFYLFLENVRKSRKVFSVLKLLEYFAKDPNLWDTFASIFHGHQVTSNYEYLISMVATFPGSTNWDSFIRIFDLYSINNNPLRVNYSHAVNIFQIFGADPSLVANGNVSFSLDQLLGNLRISELNGKALYIDREVESLSFASTIKVLLVYDLLESSQILVVSVTGIGYLFDSTFTMISTARLFSLEPSPHSTFDAQILENSGECDVDNDEVSTWAFQKMQLIFADLDVTFLDVDQATGLIACNTTFMSGSVSVYRISNLTRTHRAKSPINMNETTVRFLDSLQKQRPLHLIDPSVDPAIRSSCAVKILLIRSSSFLCFLGYRTSSVYVVDVITGSQLREIFSPVNSVITELAHYDFCFSLGLECGGIYLFNLDTMKNEIKSAESLEDEGRLINELKFGQERTKSSLGKFKSLLCTEFAHFFVWKRGIILLHENGIYELLMKSGEIRRISNSRTLFSPQEIKHLPRGPSTIKRAPQDLKVGAEVCIFDFSLEEFLLSTFPISASSELSKGEMTKVFTKIGKLKSFFASNGSIELLDFVFTEEIRTHTLFSMFHSILYNDESPTSHCLILGSCTEKISRIAFHSRSLMLSFDSADNMHIWKILFDSSLQKFSAKLVLTCNALVASPGKYTPLSTSGVNRFAYLHPNVQNLEEALKRSKNRKSVTVRGLLFSFDNSEMIFLDTPVFCPELLNFDRLNQVSNSLQKTSKLQSIYRCRFRVQEVFYLESMKEDFLLDHILKRKSVHNNMSNDDCMISLMQRKSERGGILFRKRIAKCISRFSWKYFNNFVLGMSSKPTYRQNHTISNPFMTYSFAISNDPSVWQLSNKFILESFPYLVTKKNANSTPNLKNSIFFEKRHARFAWLSLLSRCSSSEVIQEYSFCQFLLTNRSRLVKSKHPLLKCLSSLFQSASPIQKRMEDFLFWYLFSSMTTEFIHYPSVFTKSSGYMKPKSISNDFDSRGLSAVSSQVSLPFPPILKVPPRTKLQSLVDTGKFIHDQVFGEKLLERVKAVICNKWIEDLLGGINSAINTPNSTVASASNGVQRKISPLETGPMYNVLDETGLPILFPGIEINLLSCEPVLPSRELLSSPVEFLVWRIRDDFVNTPLRRYLLEFKSMLMSSPKCCFQWSNASFLGSQNPPFLIFIWDKTFQSLTKFFRESHDSDIVNKVVKNILVSIPEILKELNYFNCISFDNVFVDRSTYEVKFMLLPTFEMYSRSLYVRYNLHHPSRSLFIDVEPTSNDWSSWFVQMTFCLLKFGYFPSTFKAQQFKFSKFFQLAFDLNVLLNQQESGELTHFGIQRIHLLRNSNIEQLFTDFKTRLVKRGISKVQSMNIAIIVFQALNVLYTQKNFTLPKLLNQETENARKALNSILSLSLSSIEAEEFLKVVRDSHSLFFPVTEYFLNELKMFTELLMFMTLEKVQQIPFCASLLNYLKSGKLILGDPSPNIYFEWSMINKSRNRDERNYLLSALEDDIQASFRLNRKEVAQDLCNPSSVSRLEGVRTFLSPHLLNPSLMCELPKSLTATLADDTTWLFNILDKSLSLQIKDPKENFFARRNCLKRFSVVLVMLQMLSLGSFNFVMDRCRNSNCFLIYQGPFRRCQLQILLCAILSQLQNKSLANFVFSTHNRFQTFLSSYTNPVKNVSQWTIHNYEYVLKYLNDMQSLTTANPLLSKKKIFIVSSLISELKSFNISKWSVYLTHSPCVIQEWVSALRFGLIVKKMHSFFALSANDDLMNLLIQFYCQFMKYSLAVEVSFPANRQIFNLTLELTSVGWVAGFLRLLRYSLRTNHVLVINNLFELFNVLSRRKIWMRHWKQLNLNQFLLMCSRKYANSLLKISIDSYKHLSIKALPKSRITETNLLTSVKEILSEFVDYQVMATREESLSFGERLEHAFRNIHDEVRLRRRFGEETILRVGNLEEILDLLTKQISQGISDFYSLKANNNNSSKIVHLLFIQLSLLQKILLLLKDTNDSSYLLKISEKLFYGSEGIFQYFAQNSNLTHDLNSSQNTAMSELIFLGKSVLIVGNTAISFAQNSESLYPNQSFGVSYQFLVKLLNNLMTRLKDFSAVFSHGAASIEMKTVANTVHEAWSIVLSFSGIPAFEGEFLNCGIFACLESWIFPGLEKACQTKTFSQDKHLLVWEGMKMLWSIVLDKNSKSFIKAYFFDQFIRHERKLNLLRHLHSQLLPFHNMSSCIVSNFIVSLVVFGDEYYQQVKYYFFLLLLYP
jgi:hypothetical protein